MESKDNLFESHEEYKQQLHLAKQKEANLQYMINEMKEDNEILTIKNTNLCQQLDEERAASSLQKTKIVKLESNLEDFNNEFSQYKELAERMKQEDTKPKEVNCSSEGFDSHLELLTELNKYKDENEILNSNIVMCKEQSSMKLSELMEKVMTVETELDETKQLLNDKSQQLIEANSMLEDLKEEKILLMTELQSLKSSPADVNVRGNSLFAEVEDKYKEIKIQLKTMCSKYTKLKTLFQHKNYEFTRMRNECALLQLKSKENKNMHSKADDRLIAAQRVRIKELEKMLQQYENKSELPDNVEKGNSKSFSWAQGMINAANDEVTRLRREICTNSMNKWIIEQDLHEKTIHLSQARQQLLDLKMELAKYKQNHVMFAKSTESNADDYDAAIHREPLQAIDRDSDCVERTVRFCK